MQLSSRDGGSARPTAGWNSPTRHLGVLGFGRIGQQVARRAAGLSMRSLRAAPSSPDRFRELGVERVESERGLRRCGFPHAASAADRSDARLDQREGIRRMRNGVRIVNAARGALVDEDDLLEALKSGKVGGAALDVFSTEPYTGPLLGLDNVVATPHLAASTEEAQDRAGVIIAEQVAAALDGGLVSNAVNIPVIGAEDLEVLGASSLSPRSSDVWRWSSRPGTRGGTQAHLFRRPRPVRHEAPDRGRAERSIPGSLRPTRELPVNTPMIAERGVEVQRERSRAARDYTNLVRVEAVSDGVPLRIAGTTMGNDNRLWLVSALGFELDMELAPLLVVLRYDDVPGVIGKVGDTLGGSAVNIANMTVSRATGRAGADGPLDRHVCAAGARREGPLGIR